MGEGGEEWLLERYGRRGLGMIGGRGGEVIAWVGGDNRPQGVDGARIPSRVCSVG